MIYINHEKCNGHKRIMNTVKLLLKWRLEVRRTVFVYENMDIKASQVKEGLQ